MKYQRRKTVPTLRKLVSDGREVSTEDAQSKGSKSRKAGPTTRDHRGQRARRSGGRGEADEGRGTRRQRRSGTTAGRAGWEHPAACRAPRVPADLQRAQNPAPTAGHHRLRPGQGSRTRRRGRFLSGPGAERPEPGRGVGSRAGQWGAHLSSRAASARACAVEEFCVRLEGVLPQVSTIPPGAHSHRHRSRRNHHKPGLGSSRALGSRPSAAGEHAQSPRSRGSAAGERYLRSTGPGPRPRPWRSPLPLALRPALSGARPRPLWTPRPALLEPQLLWPRWRQPRFEDLVSFPGSRSRVPARTGGLRQ